MLYLDLEAGLYLITQNSFKKGVQITHNGILDVGNVLGYVGVEAFHRIVFLQTPPRLRADYLCHTGEWIIISKISDVQGAAIRIQQALQNPQYDLFGNNCEHFARFVA